MSQGHRDKFWKCFPSPPDQSAVGDCPQDYLAKLNKLCELTLDWPEEHPTGRLARSKIRKLCRDPKVNVLIAYASVMAWGRRGVHSPNYKLSLSAESRSALIPILKELRESTRCRQSDFEAMKLAAKNIKGLGISFYTKLLFFFRENPDAYILDQFTAKSAKLLFDPCQVILNSSGYPDPSNTPASYEWYCASVEEMGKGRRPLPTWTGEQTEQAMFDVGGGEWRKYILSIYGKAGGKKTKNAKFVAAPTSCLTPLVPTQVAGGNAAAAVDGGSLPARVVRAHAAAFRAECELPGAAPQVGAAAPVRVHCSVVDGVIWQYAFHQSTIHAEVFIPARHVTRYEALRQFLGVDNHDFGDGIIGNGAANGKTRSLRLTVPCGLHAPQNKWDEIAELTISAMNVLFKRVSENL